MTKERFLEYATKYLKLGFSIIPVGIDKKPLLKWEAYQKRKPTQDEIDAWANKYKDLNIAIVTGSISGIVVVDVEAGGGTTDLPITVLSETGGGGYHFFYKHPQKPVKNSVRIRNKIDIRGDRGYVIAPPSLHKSGNTYTWLRSPEQYQFADLPEWVLVTNVENEKVKKDWEKIITSVTTEGSRNSTATQLVGKLLGSLQHQEWESVAWPLLYSWNLKNSPPLPDKELRATFESIAKRELNKPNETETPDSTKQQLINSPLSYTEVENKAKEFLPNSQTALKLVLAVAVSSNFQNPVMLWLLLVGVPSSGKTDMVRLIKDSEITYYLDNLTQNAFISGERASKSNKVYDLLPLVDKKCLIIKDWTSIFSLDEKMTKKLLGDLVGIYDKEFTKFSSRRGNISYSSAFSQLGCITPATLNRHTQYMNMVGPRFLCYTMPSTTSDAEDESYKIIFSNKDRSLIEKEARLFTSSYLNQITHQTPKVNPLSQEVQEYLRVAAKLMANCRGIVILQSASFKNEEGEDVKYYEVLDVQIEEPWRAIQQLISLSKYLAYVVGKDAVDVEELAIIKEVVVSSMPADRSQALRTIKEHEGEITAKELADLSEKSTKTSRRLLDELVALKALEKIKGSGIIATDYKISEQFKDFLLLDPTEFMSRNLSSETETPQGMQSEQKEEENEPLPY